MPDTQTETFPGPALRDTIRKLIEQRPDKKSFVLTSSFQLTQSLKALSSNIQIDDHLPRINKLLPSLCILVCEDKHLKDKNFEPLIASLRDTRHRQIYLFHQKSGNHDTRIRSLGFKRLYTAELTDEYMYYFDMYDYKDLPDWLNNRFWSNPEMWNKTRW